MVGSVRHPLNTQDFSSFLLQAQSPKAINIGFANAGNDLVNSIKQATEFNLAAGERVSLQRRQRQCDRPPIRAGTDVCRQR